MSEKNLEQLRTEAFDALREAEKKMYAYAAECEVAGEREQAFKAYENIRNATRAERPNPFFG